MPSAISVAMAARKTDATGWKWPIALMFVLLAGAFAGTLLLPETYHRKAQSSAA